MADESDKQRALLVAGLGVALALSILGALRYSRRRRAILAIDRKREAILSRLRPDGPRPGDILLFHHASDTELAVTLLTHSPFYHVALYAGDEQAVEARTRGVVRDTVADRRDTYLVIPAPEDRGDAALRWAQSKVGAPYDQKDMWLIVAEQIFTGLHIDYHPHGEYTCAQFVAEAYRNAGVNLFPDRDINTLVPADFVRLLPRDLVPTT